MAADASGLGLGRSHLGPLLLALGCVGATALLWAYRRRVRAAAKRCVDLPDTSVPEALHTLAMGPREKRALAARALAEIICGAVEILEELLDEAKGTHSEFGGGGRRPDGRDILAALLDDSAEVDEHAEAFVNLLLKCTEYDTKWDEADEWNQLSLEAVAFLRDKAGGVARLRRVEEVHRKGSIASKAMVLRLRLEGHRATVTGFDEEGVAPGMLGLNTRVYCPVCLTMCPEMVRCQQCRNVGYCTEEHRLADALRHAAWCFPLAGAAD